MKIVLAPDSYKGSLSARAVAEAMRDGVLRVVPDADTVLVPVADGGDGTLETLVGSTGGTVETTTVTGPLGETVAAGWGALGDGNTALVEMARTSGLAMVAPDLRDPRITTTYGLGEVIRAALDAGFRSFVIGIGGSATNDAGAGMAQALGARLLDADGADLPFGGAALAALDRIDLSGLDPRISESEVVVACDVSNPLCGPNGASAVYGPQKGATPAMVEELDAALGHFAAIVERDVGAAVGEVQGAGAAGGLGGGLIAFLGGRLERGVDIVLGVLKLEEQLKGADLVITGEGCMDFQTVFDKAPVGVARRAAKLGIPVIAISGSHGDGFREVHEHGIAAAVPIVCQPMTLEESSDRGAELVAQAAEEAMRFMRLGAKVFGSPS